MKRLPLVVSFLLFIALCASIAYWALQLFKPPLRPVAAPPHVASADIAPDAAAGLFGGRPGKVVAASNYQLKGVIMAGTVRDSVAILSADGKPAQAIRVGMEVTPGVSVKEVQREYVLLSEGGAIKRVDLPESSKMQVNIASAAPVANQRPVMPGTPSAPAQTGQAPAATTPPQPINAHSALFPPASQSPQAQNPQAQMPPAQSVPPTVVISPPPSAQQATPSTTPASNAPAAMTYPSSIMPAAPATPASQPGELLPPSSLQSR